MRVLAQHELAIAGGERPVSLAWPAGWDRSRPKPDGWQITPASMAAAAAATGQTILGPPLTADQMIPDTYLTSQI